MSTYDGMAADDAMRQIDDAVELAARRHEVYTEAHRQIDRVTVTQRSPDGAVEITVGSSGNVVDVRCTEQVRAMPPQQLAAAVRQCAQAAQAGVAGRVEQILRAAAPGDPLTDELVANAHRAFPPPPPQAPVSASGSSGPRQLAIGGIEDDSPRRPRRMPSRRPARRPDEEEDWGGRSIMS